MDFKLLKVGIFFLGGLTGLTATLSLSKFDQFQTVLQAEKSLLVSEEQPPDVKVPIEDAQTTKLEQTQPQIENEVFPKQLDENPLSNKAKRTIKVVKKVLVKRNKVNSRPSSSTRKAQKRVSKKILKKSKAK